LAGRKICYTNTANYGSALPNQQERFFMSEANCEEPAEAGLVFLSKSEVLKRIPVTGPTLWAWVRAGKFPKPRDISPNKTVWLQSDVDDWIRSQPTRNYKP
jgi:prophage regulatory protein